MNQAVLTKWKKQGKIPQTWSSASCEDAGESHQWITEEVHIGGDKLKCKVCGYVEYG